MYECVYSLLPHPKARTLSAWFLDLLNYRTGRMHRKKEDPKAGMSEGGGLSQGG